MLAQVVIGRHPPLHCSAAAQLLSLFAAWDKTPQSRIAQKFAVVVILPPSLMYITQSLFKKVKDMSNWLQVTRETAIFLMSDFGSGLVCVKNTKVSLCLML